MADNQTTTGQVATDSKIGAAEYFIASPLFAGFDDLESENYSKFLGVFETLPPYTKIYISSPETAEVVYSLGVKFGLSDTEISAVASLVRDTIIGNVFIKDLPKVMSSSLKIDEAKSSQLTNELISQSFGPIIEDIKQIQRTKFPDRVTAMREEAKPPVPTPPAFKTPISPQPINKPPPIGENRPPEERRFKVLNLDTQGITGSQKSLDEELKKIANVIDLRNKNSS